MLDKFFEKLKIIFQDRSLRNRILFVIGALAVFRLAAAVPLPNVDMAKLQGYLAGSDFLGILDIFSGGGLSNLSILMLGVSPYITASIIFQLLTLIFPMLKELYHEEGEAGRKKIAQYSRLLTVPLAAFQGFGMLVLLERNGILGNLAMFDRLLNIFLVVAGSLLAMWIGELISEYGIGNGVSLIIFAGIVSSLPTYAREIYLGFTPDMLPLYLAFTLIMIAVIVGVVIITEGERPIAVTYAKRVRGMKVYGGMSTYLPIRVNNAGVMPIIFALSILLFPQMIINFLASSTNAFLVGLVSFIGYVINNLWIYGFLYFVLVFLFTYFYSAVTFDPESVSENLQKSGAFIPGVRPGRSTAEYIANILYRLTLIGAIFLGVMAILPLILQQVTGIRAMAIGGTSLLIVVSVAIEFIKQIEAQISMREY
ncbi:MAG: preprotein translocase subunit SecY [Patescibacteria group bacterium]